MRPIRFLGGILAASVVAFPFHASAAELRSRKPNAPLIAPASDEAELAIKKFKVQPGFKIELYAAEPLLAHPVAFAVDEINRIYVAESFRVGDQVQDIRNHMNWLDEELASTNTAQWRPIIEKYLRHQLDHMTADSERLQLLEDTDGDGKADKTTVFAEGFNDLQSGIAADLFDGSSDEIKIAAASLAGKYRIHEASESLAQLAKLEKAGSKARVESLRALAALNDSALPRLLEVAGSSGDEGLRKEASALQLKLNPNAGAEILTQQLGSGTIGEKQAALVALGSIEDPGAKQILARWMDKLSVGKVEPALQLELLEAASQGKAPEVQARLRQFEASRPQNEIGKYIECLAGGNAAEGRKIFFEKAEASCIRCHKVGGEGGEAGPELDKSDANRSRDYLLESIVAPNKSVAPGFENVIVRLKNGIANAGWVKSETDAELGIISPEDGLVILPKKEIESRERGGSGMPEGFGDLLTKRDLRDLVEFLATLK